MDINHALEELSRLYLRLNGFIAQNLIIHSDNQGNSSGELDIVAIRLPLHSQLDRGVATSKALDVSEEEIQIVVGDCKNYDKKDNLKFNDGIRKDRDAIIKLIRWIGLMGSNEVNESLISEFNRFLNIHKDKKFTGFPTIHHTAPFGKFNIKFIFFCPSLPKWDGKGFNYIDGQGMLDFIWECLNRKIVIENCSRAYNFENWNYYEPLVRYFKSLPKPCSIKDFEKDIPAYLNSKV